MAILENPIENWKAVKGYETLYEVSDLGGIKSLTYNKIMKPILKKWGYLNISLYKNKESRTFRVHRLILITFVENVNNYPVVNHINGNKSDNRVCNLEWVTESENNTHRYIGKQKSSKYTGVQWHKATNKWLAKYKLNQKATHLGVFENEYDAHMAYVNAIKANNITNKYCISN